MKKTIVTYLVAAFSSVTMLQAQTIQEGMNHLYADRFKSAIGVFEKLIAANPNNTEAIYWLGQVYFDMDDNAKAKQLYQNAMSTNGNSPFILVGMGHVDLMESKPNDARQKFETAITSSNTKKGIDVPIHAAVGRSIVDSKIGDYNWAIQLLEAATTKDPKNTEAWLQLGNAYRKAKPGEGGGDAFMAYRKALEVNPAFAVADLRLAKIFESQRNYDRVLEYLNSAVTRDAKFAPAYYELFYYYFFRAKFAEAEEQMNKYVASTDQNWETDYLQAQLFWAKKDYATAISKAEGVAAANGVGTKPRVYRLLADAYYSKGDYANAKKASDIFLGKEKAADITLYDVQLRAEILAKSGATDEEVLTTYLSAATLDTTVFQKIDLLKKGAAFFKDQKKRQHEGTIIEKIIELKQKPTLNDYFDLTMASYFTPDMPKAYNAAVKMIELGPDQVFGYEWKFNTANIIDSVKKDSIAVPAALELNNFAAKDTVKYKKQYLSSSRFLGGFYFNARNKEKAIEYLTKWRDADPVNYATVDQYLEQAKKMGTQPPTTPKTPATTPKTGGTQPKATSGTKPAAKKTPTKKPAVKTAVVKN